MSSSFSKEEAIALWRAPLVAKQKLAVEATPEVLSSALATLLDTGSKIDSPDLTTKVSGYASGMPLLGAVLFQFCHGRIEEQSAIMLASALLNAGANPNAMVNQYTPADTFIDAMYRGSISSADALGMANVLVGAGMDANHVGHYDVATLHVKLATLEGHDTLLRTLFDGPKAIELDQSTPFVSPRRHRRTL
jgi:hypothetical protein